MMTIQSTRNEGYPTFIAGEDLERGRRIKIETGTVTDPPEVVYADAGELCHGITLGSAKDGETVAVQLPNDGGTFLICAGVAIDEGASCYGANDGKLSTVVSGPVQFVSRRAASGDGAIIECVLNPFLASAAVNVSVADAGGFTSNANVETVLAEILQHLKSAQGFIPVPLALLREAMSNNIGGDRPVTLDIPLESLRETDATNILNAAANGGLLCQDSTPILDYTNGDTDSNLRVSWAATNQDAVVFKVGLDDIDTSEDITLTLRAAMSDTNDTPVIDVDSYFNEGDTKVSNACAAVTGTSVAEYAITIAAADIPAGAKYVTIEMTPAAHANDALYLYQIRLQYKKATGDGILDQNSTPSLGFTNGDTDSAFRLAWAAGNQDPVAFQVPLPTDLDASGNVVVHLRAAMSDTNDTPTLAADTYFNEGDTKVEGASGAVTGTTYAEYTITVGNADVPAGAQTMTVELTPAAHASDILYVTAIWVEYTKTILTS